jgi:hypothetical protein
VRGGGAYRTDAVEYQRLAVIITIGTNTEVDLLWVLITLKRKGTSEAREGVRTECMRECPVRYYITPQSHYAHTVHITPHSHY